MKTRELQFRAWDNLFKKWITKDFHILGEVMAFGLINQYIFENMGAAATSLERWNDIAITQFTGLKDKNGKDIYEGDIVIYKGLSLEYPFTGEVIYKNCAFIAYEESTQCPIQLCAGIELDIIGNIFENPELLIEKQTPNRAANKE